MAQWAGLKHEKDERLWREWPVEGIREAGCPI